MGLKNTPPMPYLVSRGHFTTGESGRVGQGLRTGKSGGIDDEWDGRMGI